MDRLTGNDGPKPATGRASEAVRGLAPDRRLLLLLGLGALCLGLSILSGILAGKLHAASVLKASALVPQSPAEEAELSRRSVGLYIPGPGFLRLASLGNTTLAADWVWIKSAGYVSREFTRKGGRKFEWLKKLYETVLELDPKWESACRIGALILGAVGEDPGGALDLLHRGMRANPDSWLLPFEAGMTCLLWPGHEKEAVRYMKLAALKEGHPEIIDAIIPRLLFEAGRLEAAVRAARSRALEFTEPPLGPAIREQLKELLSRLFLLDLREAIRDFKGSSGRPPDDLKELRRAGLLAGLDLHFAEAVVTFGRELEAFISSLPEPPRGPKELARSIGEAAGADRVRPPEQRDGFGLALVYDPVSGKVVSDGLAIIEIAKTTEILNDASKHFKTLKGRPARSLEELARFYGEALRRGNKLRREWKELFKNGTPPEHPFWFRGERYPYDPETGEIALPERYRPENPPEAGEEPVSGP